MKNKPAWQALSAAAQTTTTISELFAHEPDRFTTFSIQNDDLLVDFSKQNLAHSTLQLLVDLAEQSDLSSEITKLFTGGIVNRTENRAAKHFELRNPNTSSAEIKTVFAQMEEFVQYVHSSKFSDVIVLGIGGSDLGPRLVCESLTPFRVHPLRLHFIANVDATSITPLLKTLDPSTTLCIINSKTFTTIETLANANIVKNWLPASNLIAVTANKKQAMEYGIPSAQIFEFWDWVGGRYSVWSAVGLPIALQIGMPNFRRFLAGAHAIDQHFITQPFTRNIPVMMALIGIWNNNFLHYPTLCIQPYADGLQLLPAYLQQLEMESNGKSAHNAGDKIDYLTAPVIWGGVGCNSQHAYMQMLHQGTQIVPVDFLIAVNNSHEPHELQQLLIASCLGQSQALMAGKQDEQEYKVCPGNRPSTTMMFKQLTPEIIGKIIAMYEHKVFVQGIIWQIQSFDQWGVQLGKNLIKEVLQTMETQEFSKLDASTQGLLNFYLNNKQ